MFCVFFIAVLCCSQYSIQEWLLIAFDWLSFVVDLLDTGGL